MRTNAQPNELTTLAQVDGATTEDYSVVPFTERHLLDYLRVLSKRRWTALPVTIVVTLGVAYVTFSATPVYEAHAQILIEPEEPSIISFKELGVQDRATPDFYQTQYRILQSRTLAKATIDALQLWERAELGGVPSKQHHREPVAGTGSPYVTATQARIIGRFLSRLSIEPVRNSRLVDVKFRSADPKLAAAVANALAEQYIQQTLQAKFQASKQATDWLTNQLMSQRKLVEGSELALQHYREGNRALPADNAQSIVIQKLSGLNTAVTDAKTDRIQKETLFRQLQSIRRNPSALAAFPAIQSNASVQQLKAEVADLERRRAQLATELGDHHPDMINVVSSLDAAKAKLRVEMQNAVSAAEREYRTAVAQERNLVSALDAQKAEALALNRTEIGYRVLERDATGNRQVFESLLQRTKEMGISSELKPNNIRIADRADVPLSPLWPRRRRDMLLGLLGGCILGIVLAFGREYIDNRIKSPDEIRTLLGLPCLGMVPLIPKPATPSAAPLLNSQVPAIFGEAFRAVRTNVLFASTGDRGRSLLVTSTGPGEGKTLVSSNLAVGLAMTGQRVLLLDADLRRPHAHEVFKTDLAPGVTDLVAGTAAANTTIRSTEIANLSILTAGKTSANPAEVLSSSRFASLVTALTRQFDWVIVDSPPIMPVIDAAIVAHVASAVLFVVGSERVTLPTAVRALKQLEATDARLVGAVLNSVDLDRNSFFYSPYYRREYGQYYGGQAS